MRLAGVIADAIVDWDALGKVVVASFAAGVGLSAIFGVALLGVTRAADHSRAGRPAASTGFAILGAVAFAVVVAAIVYGLKVMVSK
jgi:hypothetical protein